MLRSAILGALILWASCNKSQSSDSATGAPVGTPASAAKPGSGGGGFSADLANEIGSGGAKADGSAGGSDAAKAGSAAAAMAGSDAAKPGDATKPGDNARTGSNSVAMTAGTTPTAKPGTDATKPGTDGAKPGTDATKPGADATKPGTDATKPGVDAVKPGVDAVKPGAAAAAPTPPAVRPSAPETHGPVKLTPELAAIKLSLLPNWDRDIDEAGTFQYVVRIKGTQNTKTFSFHYGYDDAKAPSDREQYKKYLQDTRLLTGEIKDRQRGAAWFLEGVDASGLPAFRYQVLYGGKRLICYGSLYKDAESSRLGDDRDQTVIQAKQICETLAL